MLFPIPSPPVDVLEKRRFVFGNAGSDIVAVLFGLHLLVLVGDRLAHAVHNFLDPRASFCDCLLSFPLSVYLVLDVCFNFGSIFLSSSFSSFHTFRFLQLVLLDDLLRSCSLLNLLLNSGGLFLFKFSL